MNKNKLIWEDMKQVFPLYYILHYRIILTRLDLKM